jgi:methionyl aminopeptidase
VAALSAVCEASMWDGLAAARSGARLTDISHAIETSIRSAGNYGIVAGYGGHGIGSEMHMAPHILNYGRPGKGPRLTPGMALAIEPMVTLGSRATEELEDGWTVVTADGTWAAHWEHSVAILEDGPWVLTAEDGGRAELAKRGVELSALAA